ncbi:hypothetical protein ACFL5G_00415 [Candidatus Margulisiibacteriota bacterium]
MPRKGVVLWLPAFPNVFYRSSFNKDYKWLPSQHRDRSVQKEEVFQRSTGKQITDQEWEKYLKSVDSLTISPASGVRFWRGYPLKGENITANAFIKKIVGYFNKNQTIFTLVPDGASTNVQANKYFERIMHKSVFIENLNTSLASSVNQEKIKDIYIENNNIIFESINGDTFSFPKDSFPIELIGLAYGQTEKTTSQQEELAIKKIRLPDGTWAIQGRDKIDKTPQIYLEWSEGSTIYKLEIDLNNRPGQENAENFVCRMKVNGAAILLVEGKNYDIYKNIIISKLNRVIEFNEDLNFSENYNIKRINHLRDALKHGPLVPSDEILGDMEKNRKDFIPDSPS